MKKFVIVDSMSKGYHPNEILAELSEEEIEDIIEDINPAKYNNMSIIKKLMELIE